ncbi:MAG: tRNA pseudouridine(55) synthase TruB [Rhodobacteraceae bacterium]|nr:tRNA pseudouridine(55) synthase TruB [Paracoccaceae bacterium]
MARRKKGRDISGWLVVDKPTGMSSSAVVNKAKWAFDANKAGHAGTLDPEATGVLAIAFGEATKTIPYVTDALKAYEFTVRLGQATNTDDMEGEVTRHSGLRPDDDEIRSALVQFVGNIRQVPPQFSAVKVEGQRAYKLARDGDTLELSARDLWVESLKFINRPDPDHVTLEMVCGKGGYVRAIARDLGLALGCYGHVRSLRRIWSGPFDANGGIGVTTLDELGRTEALDQYLMPLETGLADLPELPVSAESAARLRNGNAAMVLHSDLEYGDEAWASYNGKAVAIGIYRAGELHPIRVFALPS